MKTVPGIQSGIAATPPGGVEATAPSVSSSAVSKHSESHTNQAPPPAVAGAVAEPSPEDIETAVAQLQESLSEMPGGGEREARLLFDERSGSYLVEIRDKESGELLQSFPPEKLLNRDRHPADVLGTVIDRRS